jgi:hypothetical protein
MQFHPVRSLRKQKGKRNLLCKSVSLQVLKFGTACPLMPMPIGTSTDHKCHLSATGGHRDCFYAFTLALRKRRRTQPPFIMRSVYCIRSVGPWQPTGPDRTNPYNTAPYIMHDASSSRPLVGRPLPGRSAATFLVPATAPRRHAHCPFLSPLAHRRCSFPPSPLEPTQPIW